ncbi:bifunctional biotin--[acetyl-CoA-carboxylase] ligase/biotin operon repressor BirA [Amphritea sp. 1_MG-2023]|uniref:bifunctional biotin--[acetyl-CoA-carboxylase] ligase/biotin operon repressor BirA n=1 Tax=Amphritea sp. 1_MG-2023 TaxID=3062670 RepID=UPI0026E145AF|nr:bifunctional biotin--[acetyl-CoA-carboxylase] ligase/biotin operon repressor BirA [Amphritea sp. 1_MG-2023]MDO6565201.1 bifunctional biotin--[acetyl-CoA-carboxylase] ligase/biotin operon repressor BirA [Amphritea sp. 1_MG-2023]
MIEPLLSVLADGKFHSGQALGEALGVSRSAIWKQIKAIEESGIEVFSVKGRGYRIPGGLDLLDQAMIEAMLTPSVRPHLQHIDSSLIIPSTNAKAMEAVYRDGHGSLYLAERQTAGRGRRGRDWASPFASNIYFSLTWQFNHGAAALEGLSLAVGVALIRGLKRMGVDEVAVKWPNDLLWRGRKLAGVLLEMSGDAAGECYVVIGVGLNVNMPEIAAEMIDQPWVDLRQVLGEAPSRNELMAALLNELVPVLQQFADEGFAAFQQEWQAVNAHHNQVVNLNLGNRQALGVCRGVDKNGALLLEEEGQLQAYHGGEVSVRLA